VNWVARTAAALIAAQLLIRAILVFGGYFYWDDLILIGRAGTQEVLSPSFLFDDHDGHVMPGAFLVAGGISRVSPLNWIGPAISLVVLQLLASLALPCASSSAGARSCCCRSSSHCSPRWRCPGSLRGRRR
jgi:hypothetical protein